MLSDETFPSDLLSSDDERDFEVVMEAKKRTSNSLDDLHSSSSSSSSSENLNNSTDITESIVNTMEIEKLIKSTDFQSMTQSINMTQDETLKPEASFKSITESSKKLTTLPPPRAPIKKKNSLSCQDLNMKKPNYDHVESKVKKLIENLTEDRRKTLLRHKSMPVCATQAEDIDAKQPSEAENMNELKRELRKKAIKIYELEEMCEMKDNQIYDLECEKSKMRMTFDKLRIEMQELKDMEVQFKRLKAQYSPNTTHRNVQIQTDEDSGFEERSHLLLNSAIYIREEESLFINPVVRQLAFENSNNLDRSHFSDVNNTSSDNLIPDQEIFLDDADDISRITRNNSYNDDNVKEKKKTKKKSKKIKKFFKFVSCIAIK